MYGACNILNLQQENMNKSSFEEKCGVLADNCKANLFCKYKKFTLQFGFRNLKQTFIYLCFSG